jgi:hypothetical protein
MAVFSIVIIFGLIYLNTYKLKNFIPAIHFSCKLENNCCTKKKNVSMFGIQGRAIHQNMSINCKKNPMSRV